MAGTVQIFPSKSISDHHAPSTSPDRVAVRTQNSSANAAMASRSRNRLMNSASPDKPSLHDDPA
jgi:hypothetical protein